MFNLHVAYRLDSDFEVEQTQGISLPYEPEYFNAAEVSKRNSLQKDFSQPTESLFLGSMNSDNSRKFGSLPNHGMSIPNGGTRWSNTSPETQSSNTGIVSKSIHAFTPPTQQHSILDVHPEDLPFSGAYKSLPKKPVIDNMSAYSASPPFANFKLELEVDIFK